MTSYRAVTPRTQKNTARSLLAIFIASLLSLDLCPISSHSVFLDSAFAQPAEPATAPSSTEQTAINEEELAKDSTTEINVKNADLAAIIRIFSRKTKRNYILDDRVKGKVSIYLPGRVSADESIRILDSVLAYKGFAAVPIGENIWKIVPSKEARQSTIPTLKGPSSGKPSSSVITRLAQLKYVAADDVKQVISQLISADGLVNSYPGTNSLILIDSEDNIERLLAIVAALDLPSSDRDMTIIPVHNAEAADIAQKLSDLLGLNSGSGSGSGKGSSSGDLGIDAVQARVREAAQQAANLNRQANAAAQGGASNANIVSSSSASAAITKQPKILPDERTNSIIVVADEDTTARIRALVLELDSEVDLSGNRFYVYRCQHAAADELANVLSGLAGGGGGTSKSKTSSSSGDGTDQLSFGSGTSKSSSRSSRSQERLKSQQRTPGRSRSEGSERASVSSVSLGENISITADPATNSLIIMANKTDYQKILELLKEIDIKRRQVLVEAILLEVDLTDSDKTSTAFITSGGGADGAFIAQNNGQNITNLLSNPAAIQDFSMAAASAGTITIGAGSTAITIPSQTVLLNAAKSNSNLNILSAPTILTTDNEQAEIVVGQNVPFLASTATSDTNLNNTFNQIDRQDVGITLRLTPQISAGEAVTLKIFTEVSSILSTDPKLGPTTTVRTSETSVITRDSQMIVIGGLMADGINESESGVPYLKDIPVLGHLFRSTYQKRERTNLLILITPRIVRDQYDARDLTIEQRNIMEREFHDNDLYPTRKEVLHDNKINQVTEADMSYSGTTPSTILPPKTEKNENTAAEGPSAGALKEKSSAPIELSVNPELPSLKQPKKQQGLNNAPSAAFASAEDLAQSSHYVVIKLDETKNIPANLPFSVSAKGAFFGLIIPADSGAKAQDFFKPGSKYTYKLGDKKLSMTPMAVLSSQVESKALFPDIAISWHTLSPYEIMNLGDGPWLTSK